MPLEKQDRSLYEILGQTKIEEVIREFYTRVFNDPMIGHFFFNVDQEHITRQQVIFATGLLGGPRNYRGKPLRAAHSPFPIRPPHFARRQVILRDVLTDQNVSHEHIEEWLNLETQFKSSILSHNAGCR